MKWSWVSSFCPFCECQASVQEPLKYSPLGSFWVDFKFLGDSSTLEGWLSLTMRPLSLFSLASLNSFCHWILRCNICHWETEKHLLMQKLSTPNCTKVGVFPACFPMAKKLYVYEREFIFKISGESIPSNPINTLSISNMLKATHIDTIPLSKQWKFSE